MRFSNNTLAEIVPGIVCISGNCPPTLFISFDIQETQKNDVFFVLPHIQISLSEIISAALKKQVVGVVISSDCVNEYKKIATQLSISPDFFVATVQDVEDTIYRISHYVKKIVQNTTIAIAGVSGARHTITILANIVKTKSLIPFILFHDQHKNMALEVAKLTINHRNKNIVIIFEAKAMKRYDMEILAKTTQPSYAVIMSVGQHSIDTIGSLQDVAAEHRAIFSTFSEKNIGIINGDQVPLAIISYPHPVIKFGLKISNQIQARKVRIKHSETHFVLKIYRNKYQIKIATTHKEQLLATLAAIAAAKLLMIADEIIIPVIQKEFVITECFEKKSVQKITNGTLISDLYTSDPENVKLSLAAFHTIETTQPKIIILGDMASLGIHSAFWHRQIGRFLRKLPEVVSVFVVGKKGNFIKLTAPKTMHIQSIVSTQQLKEELRKFNGRNPLILVKGNMSHDIQLFISQLCDQSVTI